MSCDYDIFGLDKESSTLNDAKKAYYNLALLVHPDRNACINKDTAKLEMKVLTNMYKNIKKELESRDLNNKYKECDDLVNIREKEVEEIVKKTKINNFLIGESLLKDLDKKSSLLKKITQIRA